MTMKRSVFATAACAAVLSWGAFAANGPPLASEWNIAPTGRAGSSGDLTFRVTTVDSRNPIEITVPVMIGAREDTVARSIRNSLNSQLPPQRFDVELGAGTNVLVRDARGEPNFSIELMDSDVDDLRVAVQSVTPSASPTAPPQTQPVQPPVPTPPPANEPGDATPPSIGTPSPDTAPPTPGQRPPSPGIPTPTPGQNVPTPGSSIPPPSPRVPTPGPTTPAPSPSVPTPAPTTPTPAPGTPTAPQGTNSPTPSPAPEQPQPGSGAFAPGE